MTVGRRCTSTGRSPPGRRAPDVDLLALDLADASALGRLLSARYAGLCRGVEIATATTADLTGDTDAAYGYRVFLRHYCVHLAGPDPAAALPGFPADVRAARGLNGDIARDYRRWRRELERGRPAPDQLGVHAARKTLLAVAGLVSVRDGTWTTDRSGAARRWGEHEPNLSAPLRRLLSWVTTGRRPTAEDVRALLADGGLTATVVDRFTALIGLWPDDPPAS